MCSEYIAAGLPPERFWTLTPRLYLIEMAGAAERMRRERALAWDVAVIGRDGVKPPERDAFVGPPALPQPRRAPTDWRAEQAKWMAYAAAQQARAQQGRR
jgi:hypothetical protein